MTGQHLPIVYLSGPINGCSDDAAINWRELFKRDYPGRTIDPMDRDYRGKEDFLYREIVELDKLAIRHSDVVLANVTRKSAGTSMEIHYAATIGKPVVALTNPGIGISPWVRYHATVICFWGDSVIEAIERVRLAGTPK